MHCCLLLLLFVSVTIYGDPNSGCTQAVLTAAAELHAKTDFVLVEMGKGQHKTPEHLKRQPFGKVPALQDGDFNMFESRAMVRYLNDRFPGANALIPTDPKQRAIFEQWASLEYGTINPQVSTILYQRVFGPYFYGAKTDEALVEKAVQALNPVLDVLDKHLASHGKKYLLGDQYTLVDIFLTTCQCNRTHITGKHQAEKVQCVALL